ncbi:CHAT domain-containing protein [Spirosoma sordidisoli]|nr:CHAT domain-containing tetratricopeptide repeat protein [Spirosoma sordidisoli]
MSNNQYKVGKYGQSASMAKSGLHWLAQAEADMDTLHFQLLSLTAASYGRVPQADSAAYWYSKTSGYLSVHPRLRRIITDDVCGYYMGQAYFLSRTGDLQQAFNYLQIAGELARKTGNRRLVAIIDNYIGNYFFQIRQYDQAAVYYQRALRGYKPGTVDQCWGYVILGNNDRAAQHLAAGLANLRRGQMMYSKLIAKQPQQRNVDFEIQASYYMAECLRASKQVDTAARAYRICLALHQQHYGPRGEFMAYSWLGLSHIARVKSNPWQALDFARRGSRASCYRLDAQASSADYIGTVVNEKTLYESLRLEGDIWWDEWIHQRKRPALAKAVQRYDLALTVAARLRRNLMPEESKFFLSTNVAPCIERALAGSFDLFQQTGMETDKNRLFTLMERHRTMALSDRLHEKYRMARAVPYLVIQREQSLRQQKLDLEKAAADTPPEALPDSIRKQLNYIRVESHAFLDSLEQAFPGYYALKYETRPVSVEYVQQQLPEQAGYLGYFVSDQFVIGFLITKTGSHVFRRQLPRHFSETVTHLWQSVRRDPGMFIYTGQNSATALHRTLIHPIENQLRSIERLITARDGLLHYIPFDLLTPSVSSTSYLGEQIAISYAYSAELTFARLDSLPTIPPRITGYAPYYQSIQTSDTLLPLRESLAEVRAWGGRILAGPEATKDTFIRAVKQSDVIVLATHAQADGQKSERSYVAFYPNGTDYRLRAVEIATLSLEQLKLVVLSACHGNAGVIQQSEGLLSLARAFRMAGCRTILTTSWSASDESTAALNTLFLQHLLRGLPTDLALQKARSDFRTDKRFRRWNHPYHWANFTLIGTPVTLYPASGEQTPVKWIGGLCLLCLTGAGFFFWRQLHLSKQAQAL